jgi:hypothetical protein
MKSHSAQPDTPLQVPQPCEGLEKNMPRVELERRHHKIWFMMSRASAELTVLEQEVCRYGF